MSLKTRTLLTLSAASVLLTLLLYLVLASLIGDRFAALESWSTREHLGRLQRAWDAQVGSLCEKVADWAAWDDTYRFTQDRNPEYVESNLATVDWAGMNVDYILVLDARGEPANASMRGPDDETIPIPPDRLAALFPPGSPLLAPLRGSDRRSGLLLPSGTPPVQFCAGAILPSDRSGPERGLFVFARSFDADRLATLADAVRLEVAAIRPDDPARAHEATRVAAGLDGARMRWEASDETRIRGWLGIPPASGGTPLLLQVGIERRVHAEARSTLWYLLAALALFGLAFVLAVILLIRNSVVRVLADRLGLLQASSAQLSATAAESAATAAEQASTVAEVSSTVEEIHQTSQASAENARAVLAAADQALVAGREGRASMEEALRTLDLIAEAVAVVDTVNDLAEQSNLLAVNAGIEAAKAGEEGRGFAVVAQEIRLLAEQSKTATRRIRQAIQRTDDGRASVRRVGDAVVRVTGLLEETTEKVRRIVAAAEQQTAGNRQMTAAMSAVAQGGQDTARAARQIEQAVAALEELARRLARLVGVRVDPHTTDPR